MKERWVFTTILKANLDKALCASHFNSTSLPAIVNLGEMWSTMKKEEPNLLMTDAFHSDLKKR